MSAPQVIYEVDMTMPPALWARERAWLQEHIAQMLQHDGFVGAKFYTTELLGAVDAKPMQRVCIHYQVTSRQHLEHYFEHGAPHMRADGIAHLGDGCVFRRRVLEESFCSA